MLLMSCFNHSFSIFTGLLDFNSHIPTANPRSVSEELTAECLSGKN